MNSFSDLTGTQVEVFASAWEHNIKIWGPDFFGSPPYNSYLGRLGFRAAKSLLHNLKYRRSDKWRKIMAERTVRALEQVV